MLFFSSFWIATTELASPPLPEWSGHLRQYLDPDFHVEIASTKSQPSFITLINHYNAVHSCVRLQPISNKPK